MKICCKQFKHNASYAYINGGSNIMVCDVYHLTKKFTNLKIIFYFQLTWGYFSNLIQREIFMEEKVKKIEYKIIVINLLSPLYRLYFLEWREWERGEGPEPIRAERAVSSELEILNLYVISIGACVSRSGRRSATVVEIVDPIVKSNRV